MQFMSFADYNARKTLLIEYFRQTWPEFSDDSHEAMAEARLRTTRADDVKANLASET